LHCSEPGAVASNELRRAIGAPLPRTSLQDDVSRLHVVECLQPLAECRADFRLAGIEEPGTGDACRWLGFRREWHAEGHQPDAKRELHPIPIAELENAFAVVDLD
jgi:hypothetical protein